MKSHLYGTGDPAGMGFRKTLPFIRDGIFDDPCRVGTTANHQSQLGMVYYWLTMVYPILEVSPAKLRMNNQESTGIMILMGVEPFCLGLGDVERYRIC